MATVSGSAKMTLDDLAADLDAEIASLTTNDSAEVMPDSGAVGGAVASDSVSASAGEERNESESAAAPQVDWKAQVDGLDKQELLRHNRVAGIVGDEAQKLAVKMLSAEREKIRTELETERAEREKQELLERDPYEFRERVRTEAEQNKIAAERQGLTDSARAAALQEYDDNIMYSLFGEQPETVQQALSGKHYEGDDTAARQGYIRDLIQTRVGHELVVARKRWEQDALPALRKQIAAEESGESVPVATRNTSGGRRIESPEDIEKMSLTDFEAMGLDKIMAELGI